MPTPTNRPFFSNFLAAFRAHQSVHHAVKSASSTALTATTSQSSTHGATTLRTTTSDAPPQTRTIVTTTKSSQAQQSSSSPGAAQPTGAPNTGATTMAISGHTFQPHRHHSVSPYSRSPGSVSPVGSPGGPFGQPNPHRGRRGSDSSNEGFRDASALAGGEKWYIGGRTPAGEERFYKLSMVKRPRSLDRLSADRMSL